jgi:hypothetical protein
MFLERGGWAECPITCTAKQHPPSRVQRRCSESISRNRPLPLCSRAVSGWIALTLIKAVHRWAMRIFVAAASVATCAPHEALRYEPAPPAMGFRLAAGGGAIRGDVSGETQFVAGTLAGERIFAARRQRLALFDPVWPVLVCQFGLPAELLLGIISTSSGLARSISRRAIRSIMLAVARPRRSAPISAVSTFGPGPHVCLEMPLPFPFKGAR